MIFFSIDHKIETGRVKLTRMSILSRAIFGITIDRVLVWATAAPSIGFLNRLISLSLLCSTTTSFGAWCIASPVWPLTINWKHSNKKVWNQFVHYSSYIRMRSISVCLWICPLVPWPYIWSYFEINGANGLHCKKIFTKY